MKLLLDHFLKRFNKQLNKNITSISPEALELMEKIPLAGEHSRDARAVRRAMLMATGPTIVPELLPKDILEYMAVGQRRATLPERRRRGR